MNSFTNDAINFIVRAKENRKHLELQSLIKQTQNLDLGKLTLIKDSKVQLYTGKPIHNKKGKIHYREELVKAPFRLIVAMLILIYKK